MLGEADAFREATVPADGFAVRYAEGGEGEPLLVLHGAGGLHVTAFHRLLARHARVIALEVPGFGHSERNERSQSMRELAGTILKTVDALGLEGFSVLGFSFGGSLGSWVATEQEHRIMRLVLVCPGAIRPNSAGPLQGTPEELRALLFAHPEDHELPPIDPATSEKNASMLRLLGPGRDPELEQRLAQFHIPTLVLFGTEDRIIPPEFGHVYAELMPEAYVAYVYDAGHAVEIERPEALAEIVGDFLERGPEFLVQRVSSRLLP